MAKKPDPKEKKEPEADQLPVPLKENMAKRRAKDKFKKFLFSEEFDYDEYDWADLNALTVLTEKDFWLGDYVIVFRNPDAAGVQNQAVNKEVAMQIYDKCFNIEGVKYEAKQRNLVMRDAFREGLDELTEYFDEKILKEWHAFMEDKNKSKGDPTKGKPKISVDALPKNALRGVCLTRGRFIRKVQEGVYEKTENPTRDFLTLMRHSAMIKLCQECGFRVRSFLSSDRESIYCVLYACEENLKAIALEKWYPKELELGMSDLISMEPVDESYRPLRYKDEVNGRPLIIGDSAVDISPEKKKYIDKIQWKLFAKKDLEKMEYEEELPEYMRNDQKFQSLMLRYVNEEISFDEIRNEYLKGRINFHTLYKSLYQKDFQGLEITDDREMSEDECRAFIAFLDALEKEIAEVDKQMANYQLTAAEIDSLQDWRDRKLDMIMMWQKNYEEKEKAGKLLRRPKRPFLVKRQDLQFYCGDTIPGQFQIKKAEKKKTTKLPTPFDENGSGQKPLGELVSPGIVSPGLKSPELPGSKDQQFSIMPTLMIKKKVGAVAGSPKKKKKKKKDKNFAVDEARERRLNKKQIQRLKVEARAILIVGAYRRAIAEASRKSGHTLKTLWDHLGVDPYEAYGNFLVPQKHQSVNVKQRLEAVWKKFYVTERGKMGVFSRLDRVKLVHDLVQRSLNAYQLIENKVATDYFPLHNRYDIFGDTLKSMFLPVLKAGQPGMAPITNEEDIKISRSQTSLDRKASSVTAPVAREFSINLLNEWTFRPWAPWRAPIRQIREYFGEKIALYYRWTAFYTKTLVIPAILGIPVFIIQMLVFEADTTNNSIRTYCDRYFAATNTTALANTTSLAAEFIVNQAANQISEGLRVLQAPTSPTNPTDTIDQSQANWVLMRLLNILFSVIITLWSTLTLEFWKRHEAKFAIQFGQTEFTKEESDRPGFEGLHKRSLVTDRLNDVHYSPFKRWIKILIGMIICGVFVAGGVVSEVWIFHLKQYIFCKTTIKETPFIDQRYLLPVLVNIAKILILQLIFDKIAIWFNEYENHKTPSSYERSFILKLFVFAFINYYGSCFMIAYINQQVPAYGCPGDNCFYELQQQIRAVFLVLFVKDLIFFIIPGLSHLLKRLIIFISSNKKDPWYQINTEIEHQSAKTNYTYEGEIDGTVSSYVKMVIQFGFLSLFGLSFPIIFIFAFFINILQMYIDRFRLVRLSKRTIPIGAQSIGLWYRILEFISYGSIITNASLVTYTLDSFTTLQFFWFIVLVGINFTVKFIVQELIDDVPSGLQILAERHKNIYKRIVRGYNVGGRNLTIDKGIHIPKIFGSITLKPGEDEPSILVEELGPDGKVRRDSPDRRKGEDEEDDVPPPPPPGSRQPTQATTKPLIQPAPVPSSNPRGQTIAQEDVSVRPKPLSPPPVAQKTAPVEFPPAPPKPAERTPPPNEITNQQASRTVQQPTPPQGSVSLPPPRSEPKPATPPPVATNSIPLPPRPLA